MKQTSIVSYQEIKKDGTLAREALAMIKEYGPINGRELDNKLQGGHKRIADLLAYGVIAVAFTDKDPVTGKYTAYYYFTGNPPKPITKKRKDDPLKLHELYDNAYNQGARDMALMLGHNVAVVESLMITLKDVQA